MKPKTKDEAHLRRKFAHEDEIPYEIEREARENKRIWKRQTSKLDRRIGKRDVRELLDEE
ncbi:hypothetical protein E4H12_13860 [Candidatus Thorarchaeota archaeon]|nr:MAG: hypothetical protein E4H12_13860 [Candidatus Thorarchaeota archaeon]